jgi:hypothetical protein
MAGCEDRELLEARTDRGYCLGAYREGGPGGPLAALPQGKGEVGSLPGRKARVKKMCSKERALNSVRGSGDRRSLS